MHVSETNVPNTAAKEVNCSLEKTGWRLVLYSEHHDETDSALYAGDIVSLYEPELKGYMRLVQLPKFDDRYDGVFEVQPEGERADSNAFWLVEQHRYPEVGGQHPCLPRRLLLSAQDTRS